MNQDKTQIPTAIPSTMPEELALTDEDILDALAHVPGYIDISTEDFRVVYHLAWQHALARLQAAQAAGGQGMGDTDGQNEGGPA